MLVVSGTVDPDEILTLGLVLPQVETSQSVYTLSVIITRDHQRIRETPRTYHGYEDNISMTRSERIEDQTRAYHGYDQEEYIRTLIHVLSLVLRDQSS